MKLINKNPEPNSLTVFKTDNPTLKYSDLETGFQNIRNDIRQSCIEEQFFLCAYCCDRITINSSHNEHIIPQKSLAGNNLTLDYDNIVASCQSNNSCGHKKANLSINLTPLMPECETEIVYKINGKITNTMPRAGITVSVLNLRNSALENKRKTIIDLVLFDYVDDIQNLILEDNEYLELIIEEISQQDLDGKMEAFSPIIVNAVRQFIS
jgi:uncharacterized protein (TIGR02646 family)